MVMVTTAAMVVMTVMILMRNRRRKGTIRLMYSHVHLESEDPLYQRNDDGFNQHSPLCRSFLLFLR